MPRKRIINEIIMIIEIGKIKGIYKCHTYHNAYRQQPYKATLANKHNSENPNVNLKHKDFKFENGSPTYS